MYNARARLQAAGLGHPCHLSLALPVGLFADTLGNLALKNEKIRKSVLAAQAGPPLLEMLKMYAKAPHEKVRRMNNLLLQNILNGEKKVSISPNLPTLRVSELMDYLLVVIEV